MGKQKFVRLFGRNEIHLTACAVTKTVMGKFFAANIDIRDYFLEPNQFWQRNPDHERALLKIYKRDPKDNTICHGTWLYNDTQILKIPMPFLGRDSSNGWGELQFLIKEPAKIKLARNRSFDTRVNKWVKETKVIAPKTDLGTHAYLALRFYHQDYLPPIPGDWHFEPVYVSVMSQMRLMFYKVDVFWEKEEIKITVNALDKDSSEIPKHLR